MGCDEARGLLDERLDGPLPAEQAAGLDAHVAGCDRCRTAAAGLGRVHAALSAGPAAGPGPAFTDRVAAALDRGPGAGRPRTAHAGRRERILSGAVAVLGTVAVAALAVAVLPVDAAAATVEDLVPAMPAASVPALPAAAADLLGDLGGALPAWASAAGALAALAAVAFQVVAVRRHAGGATR
jgi:anti-sigma factor RsiW